MCTASISRFVLLTVKFDLELRELHTTPAALGCLWQRHGEIVRAEAWQFPPNWFRGCGGERNPYGRGWRAQMFVVGGANVPQGGYRCHTEGEDCFGMALSCLVNSVLFRVCRH